MNEIQKTNKVLIKKDNSNICKANINKVSLNNNILEYRLRLAEKLGRDQQKFLKNYNEIFNNEEIVQFYIKSMKSTYKLPRTNWGTNKKMFIRGLTIQVIKDVANIYCHLNYGIDYEVSHYKKIKAKAYCFDLLNNVLQERFFEVYLPDYVLRFIKEKKQNAADEIYKCIYKDGIRRVRVCIEHVLPFWVTEKTYKIITEGKLKYYSNKENRVDQWNLIFEGFQKIDKTIKNLEDLSTFLGFEVNTDKLSDPNFFSKIEELYIGYRDEIIDVKEKNNGRKPTEDILNKEDHEKITNKLKEI